MNHQIKKSDSTSSEYTIEQLNWDYNLTVECPDGYDCKVINVYGTSIKLLKLNSSTDVILIAKIQHECIHFVILCKFMTPVF